MCLGKSTLSMMFWMRITTQIHICLLQDLYKIRLHFQQENIICEKEYLPIFSWENISFFLLYGFTPVLYILFIYLLNPTTNFPTSSNMFHSGIKIWGLAIKNNESNLQLLIWRGRSHFDTLISGDTSECVDPFQFSFLSGKKKGNQTYCVL